MIELKQGVNPKGIRTEMFIAIMVCEGVYTEYGKPLVITSINDSIHSIGSLHYSGQAIDIRTRFFTDEEVKDVQTKIIEKLGKSADYDVVIEPDHIHIEWQPKKA